MQGISLSRLYWSWRGPRRTAFGADYITNRLTDYITEHRLETKVPIFQNIAPWKCSMQPGGASSGGVGESPSCMPCRSF